MANHTTRGWQSAIVAVRFSLIERLEGRMAGGDIVIMDLVDQIVRKESGTQMSKKEYANMRKERLIIK